jgi:ketosteroid isomerase-like protein
MSQENVDLLRRAFVAINAREISDEALESYMLPDARFENVVTAVSEKTYQGAVGLREWVRDTFEGLSDSTRYEVDEILADGPDFVVSRVRIVGHGARSGAPVELRWIVATWFRQGKIARTAGYLRRGEAFRAVGLAE